LRAFSNDSDEIFKNSILKQHNSSCFERNYYPRTRTNSGHLEDKGVEISSRADENSEIWKIHNTSDRPNHRRSRKIPPEGVRDYL